MEILTNNPEKSRLRRERADLQSHLGLAIVKMMMKRKKLKRI